MMNVGTKGSRSTAKASNIYISSRASRCKVAAVYLPLTLIHPNRRRVTASIENSVGLARSTCGVGVTNAFKNPYSLKVFQTPRCFHLVYDNSITG